MKRKSVFNYPIGICFIVYSTVHEIRKYHQNWLQNVNRIENSRLLKLAQQFFYILLTVRASCYKYLLITKLMHFLCIYFIMNAVGLELRVLSYVTHSLSCEPVCSVFYLGGLYLFFHGVDTVVQILANNQLDTLFFMYLFISSLYMFRASQRSSSGDQIVLIHHLV